MLRGQLPLGKEAGGFDHHLHPLVTPRDLGRVALGNNPDGPAVHDHGVSIHFHALLQPAVNRVVAQQVGQRLGTGDVIDGHDFHRGLPVQRRPKHVPANSSETVDSNSQFRLLLLELQSFEKRRPV